MFAWRALVLTLAFSGGVLAQTTDGSTVEGRKRFRDGLAAAEAGRYDAARTAFQQAFLLNPLPVIAKNLAEAEIKTGHPVDAAKHLEFFLREAHDVSSAD